MQLIKQQKTLTGENVLNFVSEGVETEADYAFIEFMKQYTITANGASILIRNSAGALVTHINPFDNTQLVVKDDFVLAKAFGAKRFLAGDLGWRMTDEDAKPVGAIHFKRDLTFPLETKWHSSLRYPMTNLAGVLCKFRSKGKFYTVMNELLNRCAGFTQIKQDEEYFASGEKDKYCRFNFKSCSPTLVDNSDNHTVSSEQIFLLDNDAHESILGTISATIVKSSNGKLTIYFYDEVVDYYKLLSASEIAMLDAKVFQLQYETDDTAKAKLKDEIAILIEPKRAILMEALFHAARVTLRISIPDLDMKIALKQVNAFIRAAEDRVNMYVELGCSATNTEHFVIHGPATQPFKMLDAYVKAWAAKQLQALQPRVSNMSLLSNAADERASYLLSRLAHTTPTGPK